MSAATVKENIFCGYLGIETKENSGVFEKKFFRLDPERCQLQYYSEKETKQGIGTQPDGLFNISYLSMAADASSVRPKLQHCFYVVVSGRKYYFQASNDCEKQTWVQKLLDASRITVPQRQSLIDQAVESGFRVEVVGGVVVKTPLEAEKSERGGDGRSEDVPPSRTPSPCRFQELVIKTGYCVKQGIFRKSWKRRFFILTPSSLKYCRSQEDKVPLGVIDIRDVKEIRASAGNNLSRENVFEITTPQRVFYIQASSVNDRDAWIAAINKGVHQMSACKVTESSIQRFECGP